MGGGEAWEKKWGGGGGRDLNGQNMWRKKSIGDI